MEYTLSHLYFLGIHCTHKPFGECVNQKKLQVTSKVQCIPWHKCTQGSYGSCKTWKVLKFYSGISQDWKVMENVHVAHDGFQGSMGIILSNINRASDRLHKKHSV